MLTKISVSILEKTATVKDSAVFSNSQALICIRFLKGEKCGSR